MSYTSPADAVTTPYQAVVRSGLAAGELAIVIGVGGVGGYAVQIACAMGARVVLLAGMDGYGGAPSKLAHSTAAAEAIKCPVRVVGGGPLTKFWPAYDPAERFGRYTPHPAVEGLRGVDNECTIRVLKPLTLRGVERQRGEELTLMRHEVAKWIKHRMVAEL